MHIRLFTVVLPAKAKRLGIQSMRWLMHEGPFTQEGLIQPWKYQGGSGTQPTHSGPFYILHDADPRPLHVSLLSIPSTPSTPVVAKLQHFCRELQLWPPLLLEGGKSRASETKAVKVVPPQSKPQSQQENSKADVPDQGLPTLNLAACLINNDALARSHAPYFHTVCSCFTLPTAELGSRDRNGMSRKAEKIY